MNLTRLRLKGIWLLVIPFFWFARPTPGTLLTGGVIALCGVLVRGWAAGTIHKEQTLTTTGPYAFTRNPLYLGTLFIGIGITVAGGHWVWPTLFGMFFLVVYGKTAAEEASRLSGLFGERFTHYARSVPAFIPRLTPYHALGGGDGPGGFRIAQYVRNREWEALLGVAAVFGLLGARLLISGS